MDKVYHHNIDMKLDNSYEQTDKIRVRNVITREGRVYWTAEVQFTRLSPDLFGSYVNTEEVWIGLRNHLSLPLHNSKEQALDMAREERLRLYSIASFKEEIIEV